MKASQSCCKNTHTDPAMLQGILEPLSMRIGETRRRRRPRHVVMAYDVESSVPPATLPSVCEKLAKRPTRNSHLKYATHGSSWFHDAHYRVKRVFPHIIHG